jgi:predicted porin
MKQASIRLSTLAAATLMAGMASAQAQNVTLYGAVGLDLRYATGIATAGKSKSVIAVEDNAIVNSRIGIKGGEDLGAGLKVFFDLESSVSPDTGAARTAFWNRNAFVGLSGGLGTLKIGHQWNVADDYMCGYFVCAYYAPFLMSGFYSLSDYYDNTIKYTSPNVGGLEGGVSYTLGEQAGKTTSGQKFQAAANYAAGPFGVGAVVFSEKGTAGGTNTMYALGASYDMGPAKLRAGLATAEVKVGADFKATLIDLGVDVPLSAAASVSADYVMKDVDSGGDDVSFLRLRGSYALSKRTALNANFIYLKNSGSGTYAFVGSTEAGKSQTILTAGITHSF